MDERELASRHSCSNPALRSHLTDYCLGTVTSKQRRAFEIHLLECPVCWRDVMNLHDGLKSLRGDTSVLQDLTPASLATMFGISSETSLPYAGHQRYVYAVSAIYALNWVSILFLETAYQIDRLAVPLALVSVVLLLGVFFSTSMLFRVGAERTRSGKHNVGWLSVMSLIALGLLLFGLLCLFLPDRPITQKVDQSLTARFAYLKDLQYLVPVAAIFVVLPFHFVVAMQREMLGRREAAVLRLLSGDQAAVPPRGTVYPRLALLWVVLSIMVVGSFVLTWNLVDKLKPGALANLFTFFVFVRLILYFGLWIVSLTWYGRMLNDLKRECVSKGTSI